MTKMRAIDAAIAVLKKEGVTKAFGVPGAAINPFYSALKLGGGIEHILARHVEGLHTWRRATPVQTPAILVCVLAPLDLRALT